MELLPGRLGFIYEKKLSLMINSFIVFLAWEFLYAAYSYLSLQILNGLKMVATGIARGSSAMN